MSKVSVDKPDKNKVAQEGETSGARAIPNSESDSIARGNEKILLPDKISDRSENGASKKYNNLSSSDVNTDKDSSPIFTKIKLPKRDEGLEISANPTKDNSENRPLNKTLNNPLNNSGEQVHKDQKNKRELDKKESIVVVVGRAERVKKMRELVVELREEVGRLRERGGEDEGEQLKKADLILRLEDEALLLFVLGEEGKVPKEVMKGEFVGRKELRSYVKRYGINWEEERRALLEAEERGREDERSKKGEAESKLAERGYFNRSYDSLSDGVKGIVEVVGIMGRGYLGYAEGGVEYVGGLVTCCVGEKGKRNGIGNNELINRLNTLGVELKGRLDRGDYAGVMLSGILGYGYLESGLRESMARKGGERIELARRERVLGGSESVLGDLEDFSSRQNRAALDSAKGIWGAGWEQVGEFSRISGLSSVGKLVKPVGEGVRGGVDELGRLSYNVTGQVLGGFSGEEWIGRRVYEEKKSESGLVRAGSDIGTGGAGLALTVWTGGGALTAEVLTVAGGKVLLTEAGKGIARRVGLMGASSGGMGVAGSFADELYKADEEGRGVEWLSIIGGGASGMADSAAFSGVLSSGVSILGRGVMGMSMRELGGRMLERERMLLARAAEGGGESTLRSLERIRSGELAERYLGLLSRRVGAIGGGAVQGVDLADAGGDVEEVAKAGVKSKSVMQALATGIKAGVTVYDSADNTVNGVVKATVGSIIGSIGGGKVEGDGGKVGAAGLDKLSPTLDQEVLGEESSRVVGLVQALYRKWGVVGSETSGSENGVRSPLSRDYLEIRLDDASLQEEFAKRAGSNVAGSNVAGSNIRSIRIGSTQFRAVNAEGSGLDGVELDGAGSFSDFEVEGFVDFTTREVFIRKREARVEVESKDVGSEELASEQLVGDEFKGEDAKGVDRSRKVRIGNAVRAIVNAGVVLEERLHLKLLKEGKRGVPSEELLEQERDIKLVRAALVQELVERYAKVLGVGEDEISDGLVRVGERIYVQNRVSEDGVVELGSEYEGLYADLEDESGQVGVAASKKLNIPQEELINQTAEYILANGGPDPDGKAHPDMGKMFVEDLEAAIKKIEKISKDEYVYPDRRAQAVKLIEGGIRPYHFKATQGVWKDAGYVAEVLEKKFDQLLGENFGGDLAEMIGGIGARDIKKPLKDKVGERVVEVSMSAVAHSYGGSYPMVIAYLKIKADKYDQELKIEGKDPKTERNIYREYQNGLKPYHMNKSLAGTPEKYCEEILEKRIDLLVDGKFEGSVGRMLAGVTQEDLKENFFERVGDHDFKVPMSSVAVNSYRGSPYPMVIEYLRIKADKFDQEQAEKKDRGEDVSSSRNIYREYQNGLKPYHMKTSPKGTIKQKRQEGLEEQEEVLKNKSEEILEKRIDLLVTNKFGRSVGRMLGEVIGDDLIENFFERVGDHDFEVRMSSVARSYGLSPYPMVIAYLRIKADKYDEELVAKKERGEDVSDSRNIYREYQNGLKPYHMNQSPKGTSEKYREEILEAGIDKLLEEKFGGDHRVMLAKIRTRDLIENFTERVGDHDFEVSMSSVLMSYMGSPYRMMKAYYAIKKRPFPYTAECFMGSEELRRSRINGELTPYDRSKFILPSGEIDNNALSEYYKRIGIASFDSRDKALVRQIIMEEAGRVLGPVDVRYLGLESVEFRSLKLAHRLLNLEAGESIVFEREGRVFNAMKEQQERAKKGEGEAEYLGVLKEVEIVQDDIADGLRKLSEENVANPKAKKRFNLINLDYVGHMSRKKEASFGDIFKGDVVDDIGMIYVTLNNTPQSKARAANAGYPDDPVDAVIAAMERQNQETGSKYKINREFINYTGGTNQRIGSEMVVVCFRVERIGVEREEEFSDSEDGVE